MYHFRERMIASYDIGMTNLALCVLREDGTVHDWRLVDLGTTNTHEATARVVQHMDALLDGPLAEVTMVLLESQPHMNPKMKQVATAVQVYWLCRRAGVVGVVGGAPLPSSS